MSVYLQAGSDHFIIEFHYKGVRYRRTSEHTKKRLAQQEEAEWRREVREGKSKTVVPMTLGQAAKRYTAEVVEVGREDNLEVTTRSYRYQLNQLIDFFGRDTPLTAVIDRIPDFKAKKLTKDGCAPRTYYRLVAVLGAVLNCAVQWKGLAEAPEIERDKSKKSSVRFLTAEEESRLLAACREVDGQDLWDVVAFALDTGGRRSCCLRLEKPNILTSIEMTHFAKSKTDKERSVPWTNRVREILLRRLELPGRMVFPWDANTLKVSVQGTYRGQSKPMRGIYRIGKTGRYEVKMRFSGRQVYGGCHGTVAEATSARDALIAQNSEVVGNRARPDLATAFERAVKLSGIDHFTFHHLRHTFASRLAMNGRTQKEIADLLGHADVSTTDRYTHLMPQRYRDAVATLNQSPLAQPQTPPACSTASRSRPPSALPPKPAAAPVG